ncbi:unnamed protein product [Amoebophrya sp. A120]|nr:unnamed protein product [Amoebophrya sp. A120]|eukprot:GSA120T00017294001.1
MSNVQEETKQVEQTAPKIVESKNDIAAVEQKDQDTTPTAAAAQSPATTSANSSPVEVKEAEQTNKRPAEQAAEAVNKPEAEVENKDNSCCATGACEETTKADEEKPSEAKMAEPAAKLRKTDDGKAVDDNRMQEIKKQVEYYLSDKNLKHDEFFHNKISQEENGFLEMDDILKCNNIKNKLMVTDGAEICTALKSSATVECVCENEKMRIRRKDGKKTLPKLEPRPAKGKGKGKGKGQQVQDTTNIIDTMQFEKDIFRSGPVLRITDLPEGMQWNEVKGAFLTYVKENKDNKDCAFSQAKVTGQHGGKVMSVSKVLREADNGKAIGVISKDDTTAGPRTVYVMISGFPGDISYFKNNMTEIKIEFRKKEGEEAKDPIIRPIQVVTDIKPLNSLFENPEVMNKEQKERRKRVAHERSKQQREKGEGKIVVGNVMTFENLQKLKAHVRQIQQARKDGDVLDSTKKDFKLIATLLDAHPRGKAKKENMSGLKIDISEQGNNRCFWVMKKDGSKEDFSMIKIYDELERNVKLLADAKAPVMEAEEQAPAGSSSAASAPAEVVAKEGEHKEAAAAVVKITEEGEAAAAAPTPAAPAAEEAKKPEEEKAAVVDAPKKEKADEKDAEMKPAGAA